MKKYFLIIIFSSFFTGCLRINTDPRPIFEQIQEDVNCSTGWVPRWETCLEEHVAEILNRDLTEESAVQVALLNNRQLQAFYEKLGIAQAELAQAGLLKNPIFSLSYLFSTTSAVTDLIEMGLVQNFLEILLIPLKKRMAREELQKTRAEVTAHVFKVIAQTKSAFLNLQAAECIWHLKKTLLLISESSYEAAKRLLEAGNITQFALSEKLSFYQQTRLELAAFEIILFEAREKLNRLMGLCSDQICWKVSEILKEVPKEKSDWCTIEMSAIACSLDLEMLRHEIYATGAKYGIDKTRIIFPQIEMGPASQREESIWYVGPGINIAIPLFDFGGAIAAKGQAEMCRLWNEYIALIVEIGSRARMARFRTLTAYEQSHYYYSVMIPLAEQLIEENLLQYNAMQVGLFQLLAVKKQEIETTIRAIEMQRDYWIARTELELILQGHLMKKEI